MKEVNALGFYRIVFQHMTHIPINVQPTSFSRILWTFFANNCPWPISSTTSCIQKMIKPTWKHSSLNSQSTSSMHVLGLMIKIIKRCTSLIQPWCEAMIKQKRIWLRKLSMHLGPKQAMNLYYDVLDNSELIISWHSICCWVIDLEDKWEHPHFEWATNLIEIHSIKVSSWSTLSHKDEIGNKLQSRDLLLMRIDISLTGKTKLTEFTAWPGEEEKTAKSRRRQRGEKKKNYLNFQNSKMDVRFQIPQTSPNRAQVCMQPRVAVNKLKLHQAKSLKPRKNIRASPTLLVLRS